jgi:tetratricopeptide (TPR) repeat protein
VLGAAIAVASGARALAAPDPVNEALAATDAADRTLEAEVRTLRAALGENAPPDPDTILRETTAESFESGFRLVQAVEAWRGVIGDEVGWSVIIGSAPPESFRTARIACRAVLALCAGAVERLDRAVEAADRATAEGRGAATEDEVARALHLRQVVVPLRGARATVLLALSEREPRARARLAAAALGAAARVEAVSDWSESERLIVSGLALSASERDEEALRVFEKVFSVEAIREPEGALSALVVDAALGEAMTLLRLRGPFTARAALLERTDAQPFVRGSARDAPSCLAAIDALFLIAPAEAAAWQDAAKRDDATASPWRAAHALACGLADAAARAAVYSHVSERPPPVAVDAVPAVARLALVWRRMRAGDADAAAILDPIADPNHVPRNPVERDAWQIACAAGEGSDDPARLARIGALGLAYARCCPRDEHAEAIVAAGARAAEKRLRTARGEAEAEAEATLLALLRALAGTDIRVEDARRDSWRLALGRALQSLIRRGPLDASMEHARESAAVLGSVTTSDLFAEADTLLAGAWSGLLRLAQDASIDDPALAAIARRLDDLTDPKHHRAASDPWLGDMRAYRGQALVALGRPADALMEMESLLHADALDVAPALAVESAVEALAALERGEDARALMRFIPDAESALTRLSDRAWKRVAPWTTGFMERNASRAPAPMAVFELARAASSDPVRGAAHLGRLGWAYLLNDGPDRAAECFEGALRESPTDTGLRRGLGESRLAAGDDAAAFAAFRAVARVYESRGEHPRDYWLAWARMLDILARRPRTPEGAASIRREIARLRSLDAALDHPDCMVRIRAVEDALTPR